MQARNVKIFATFIQNSFIYKAMKKSVGEVWHPFYEIKWKIASLLVRLKTVSIEGAKKTLANPQFHALIIEILNEDRRDKCAAILSSFGFVPEWAHPELTRNEIWLREGIK